MQEIPTQYSFVKEYGKLIAEADKLTAKMQPGNRCGWYWRWEAAQNRYVGYLYYNPNHLIPSFEI